MGNQNGSMVLGLKTRIKYTPWLAGWHMGGVVCAAPPHPSECRCVSLFSAGHWLSVLSHVLGTCPSGGSDLLNGRPCGDGPTLLSSLDRDEVQGHSPQAVASSWAPHRALSTASSVLAVSPLGPGPERLPQMQGWWLQEHRRWPRRTLRNAGLGVGTAAATPSCPSSAPGHRRSSWGHILSSHPHLCPRRTGAPWSWVCSPVRSPLSQLFLQCDASPRGWGPGLTWFPPWWRLWRVGTLGTGQPGQPRRRRSDAVTGSEKRPYVATQEVSIKDLLFNFKAVCVRNDSSASLCAWSPPSLGPGQPHPWPHRPRLAQ